MTFNPHIGHDLAHAQAAERHETAARLRLVHDVSRRRREARRERGPEPIIIREATAADSAAIAEIAALESAPVPEGRPLVVIAGGRLRAVLDPETGKVLSDPFAPSNPMVPLARAYAAAMHDRAA